MSLVDGRTDRDKLLELINLQEQTHLEFKSSIDLRTKRGKAVFVKDIVALANSHPGGYMVVGVDDNGNPCQRTGALGDLALYDAARVSDLINANIEASIQVVTQPHIIGEHEVVLILVRSPQSGLPIPFSKMAQFENSATGKMELIYRSGDIVRRENAKVAPLRWSHWEEILKHRDAQIRAEARAATDDLISELISEVRGSRQHGATPQLINPKLAPQEFAEAVEAYFESASPAPLTKVILRVASTLSDPETFESGLQQLSVLAVNALLFEKYSIYESVLDKLYETYRTHHKNDAKLLVRYVSYIYAIGSCAVRLKRWKGLRTLVDRPIDVSSYYQFSSWIRHAQVEATRSDLFDHQSLMISDARHLQVTVPGLAPDLEDIEPIPADELPLNDALVNSLCQFDLLYCLLVELYGTYEGNGYPASSMMAGERALPIIADLMQDDTMWHALFPDKTREDSAGAIVEVLELARRESHRSGHWWHAPRNVDELLEFRR